MIASTDSQGAQNARSSNLSYMGLPRARGLSPAIATSKTRIGPRAMQYDFTTSREFASSLLEGARLHGENDDPDHEVGDLRTFFIACWSAMSPEQRALALSDPQVQEVIGGPDYAALFS